MTVPHRRFGRTNLQIPAITFGGGWVGGLLIHGSEEDRRTVLDRALEAGIDWVDTAPSYGQGVSEQVIGAWRDALPADRRPRLSTKVHVDPAAGHVAGQIASALDESFSRLRVDQVPVLILHNPIASDDGPRPDPRAVTASEVLDDGGIAEDMELLRGTGAVDFIGFTALGDPDALHQVADSGRFDVAQVYYNMLNPSAAEPAGPGWTSTDFNGLLARCRAQDMGVMCIRIFAGGHLAATERHGREIPITANAENAAEEARAAAVFAALGEEHSSRARAALRFGLACPDLSTIVLGIGAVSHLDEALQAVSQGPLPDDAIERLKLVWERDPAFRAG
ncbi:MAG: aldo/keto reductase [Alphaproteobacteria bacterium]|nr:aldo/keto reductase [Alphaproteobacteria bacterium]